MGRTPLVVGNWKCHNNVAEARSLVGDLRNALAAVHGVEVGERYIAGETIRKRWLPLAVGEKDVQTRLIERRPDGTSVAEATTTIRGRVKLGLDVAGGAELQELLFLHTCIRALAVERDFAAGHVIFELVLHIVN